MSSISSMDKMIQNVVASFQMDHIEVTPEIIVDSKERMMLQENVKNSFGKKLSRRGTVYYGKR